MTLRIAARLCAAILLAGPLPALAVDRGAPPAPRGDVHDTYHGVTVADPYRWLENGDAPRVVAWEQAENIRARATLDALPVRARVAARLKSLYGGASPSWRFLRAEGGRVFALVTAPPRQQPMVAVLAPDLDPARQRIVIDPNALDPTGQTAIDWFVPSPDGRLVAASLSHNGSEDGTVHVFRVADGGETGDVVPRAQFPTAGGGLAWAPDSRGFWVTRYPGTERPQADRHFFQQVVFHTLGTPPATDRNVLGHDFPRLAEVQLDTHADPNLLLVSVANGDGGEYEHFAVGPDGIPHQVTRFADQVVAATAGADGSLYLVSRKDAPRGKILKLAPGDADLSHATTLVPQGNAAIQGGGEFGGDPVVVTDRAIYVRQLVGGPSRVAIFDHEGKPAGTLPLPPVAAVSEVDPLAPGRLAYSVETYLAPPRFLAWNEAAHASTATSLVERSPVSFADAELVRVFATSKDGTKIPVNIIRKRGIRLDGRNSSLLYGYGGYGDVLAPQFAGPVTRVWLDAGGVYAIANLRGGGEWGEDWHRKGALTYKQNVFDDFNAASHLLIDQHYTGPAHLAIMGRSNGGLLMGAALTQHPELYRAVVSLVGIYDMMRVELDPNGAFNTTEFGTVTNEAQFRAMLAYSPYHHVVSGTAYPAVFMATGAHDGRVNPAHSRKMVAALQAATTSGRPILLAISDKSGHGFGSSLDVKVAQGSDDLAFLFDELGMSLAN